LAFLTAGIQKLQSVGVIMALQTMIYLMKMWSVIVRMIVFGLPNQELQLSVMTNVTAVE
jgi:hypothetical protein